MKQLTNIAEQDTLAIVQVLQAFEHTWNEKDIDGMVALFTDDAEFTDIMGNVARGKDKIKQMHEFVFGKMMKGATLHIDSVYTRAISEGLVLATSKWSTDGHTDSSGKEMPQRRGLIQFVCQNKGDGAWKISLVYNTDFTQLYVQSAEHELKFFENKMPNLPPRP